MSSKVVAKLDEILALCRSNQAELDRVKGVLIALDAAIMQQSKELTQLREVVVNVADNLDQHRQHTEDAIDRHGARLKLLEGAKSNGVSNGGE